MKRRQLLLALAGVLWLAPVFAVGPSFRPDATVRGSSLNGWHALGQADWKALNGEIVGTPKPGGAGGWLVLDRSYQDVGLYASFRCTGGCKTGVLMRAEKTPQGMKGIYFALTGEEVASYRITLDVEGKELQREPLRRGGGQMRIAPPVDPNAAARGAGGPGGAARGGGGGRGAVPTVTLPIPRPSGDLRPNEWNSVELLLDANIIRAFLNEGGELGAVAEDDAGKFGPLALYVGGTGEVRFKDVAYKDLGLHEIAAEQVSNNFRMQKIDDFYYSWGAAAGDFNHDGVVDVVAGPYYYLGPDYSKRREIFLGYVSNPGTEYSFDTWMQFAGDFTGDGWDDVITASFSPSNVVPERGVVGVWLYVNPKGEPRRWDRHRVVPTFQSEIAVLRDVDGDGKPELVYAAEGALRYARPDPANPTGPWIVRSVSEPGYTVAHGIGVGDINGDKRMDIVNAYGWWQQPDDGRSTMDDRRWTYHPEAFARYTRNVVGGSVMAVYDANGDGLNDVVTSLSAHGWGLAWYEQKRDASGKISFVQHMIMDDFSTKNAGDVTFSQPHGSTFADIDGDRIPDFVVGKRYWAHRDDFLDPDPYGPGVLYVYKTVRNAKAPGGAEFVPELVHNRSGVGSDALAVDLNKDSVVDIVTATKTGTFIFWGKPRTTKGAQR
jgi:hypothetical protein